MGSRQFIQYLICLFALSSLMLTSIGQTDARLFKGTLEFVNLDIAFQVPDNWLMPEIVNRDGQFQQKETAIRMIVEAPQNMYLPADAPQYSWTVYENEGRYALLLSDANGETFWAEPTQHLEEITLDRNVLPLQIESYTQMSQREILPVLEDLREMNFGTSAIPIRMIGPRHAGSFVPRYTYNPDEDSITNEETGTVYTAQVEGLYGRFVSETDTLAPGYTLFAHAIPFSEYVELATSLEALQGEQGVVAQIGAISVIHQDVRIRFLSLDAQTRITGIVDLYDLSYRFDDSTLTTLDPSTAAIDYIYDGGMSGLRQNCFVMTKTLADSLVVFLNLCAFDDDAEAYKETMIQLLDTVVVTRLP